MDTLSGAVERIAFYNPENGYTVLRLRPDAHLDAHPGVKKMETQFDRHLRCGIIAPASRKFFRTLMEKGSN
jgi:hypothetical protein